MNPEQLRELLPAVLLGVASPEERAAVQAAMAHDPALQQEARELELALTGLAATAPAPAPVGLKDRLLERARQERPDVASTKPPAPVIPWPAAAPRRRPLPLLAGALALAAAVAGVLVLNRPAGVITDAAVIANTRDGGLVYANSGLSTTPIVLVDAAGARRTVSFKPQRPAFFTRAVTAGNLSYLLDTANAEVLIVNLDSGEVIDEWPVQPGAAGLDVQGDTVVVKSASSGTLLTFRQNGLGNKTMVEARVAAQAADMPLDATMDAAVIESDRAYVTHHMTGTVAVMDLTGNREVARYQVGQKPVSLAVDGDALLVLDLTGKLFRLNKTTGTVLAEQPVEGNPDRLTLAPNRTVYLSDRAGYVTAIQSETLEIVARKKLASKLMDLTPMPDGHLAVAAASNGVLIVDDRLEMVKSY